MLFASAYQTCHAQSTFSQIACSNFDELHMQLAGQLGKSLCIGNQ
ncbi:hypothetical protein IMCC9480_3676 [Oxalobacteraceae bacterium IMCC9480]|nr:hypothetical protein IMCC9480_3676 [Oxalobacteraceae bacterium IMCC9480]